MLERLHPKRSEQPSTRGNPLVSKLRNLFRVSVAASILALPQMSAHFPERSVSNSPQQEIDRMRYLLETTIQKLFDDVTVAEVLRVFSMSPQEFKRTHPKQYGLSLTLAEALCLEPDRFQESYDLFVQHLCKNARKHDFPLPEFMIRRMITEEMIKEELAFLLQHNRKQDPSMRVHVLPVIRDFLQVRRDERFAMREAL